MTMRKVKHQDYCKKYNHRQACGANVPSAAEPSGVATASVEGLASRTGEYRRVNRSGRSSSSSFLIGTWVMHMTRACMRPHQCEQDYVRSVEMAEIHSSDTVWEIHYGSAIFF